MSVPVKEYRYRMERLELLRKRWTRVAAELQKKLDAVDERLKVVERKP